jgi:hypothetical protein
MYSLISGADVFVRMRKCRGHDIERICVVQEMPQQKLILTAFAFFCSVIESVDDVALVFSVVRVY